MKRTIPQIRELIAELTEAHGINIGRVSEILHGKR
jgi:hypothetical protein